MKEDEFEHLSRELEAIKMATLGNILSHCCILHRTLDLFFCSIPGQPSCYFDKLDKGLLNKDLHHKRKKYCCRFKLLSIIQVMITIISNF